MKHAHEILNAVRLSQKTESFCFRFISHVLKYMEGGERQSSQGEAVDSLRCVIDDVALCHGNQLLNTVHTLSQKFLRL